MTLTRSPLLFRWWSKLPLRTQGLLVVTVPLCTVLFCFVSSLLINREQDRADRMVEHSASAISQAQILMYHMVDAEREVDAYAIAHDTRLMEEYHAITKDIPATMARLIELVADHAPQTNQLQLIQSHVTAQLTRWNSFTDGVAATGAANEAQRQVEDQRSMSALRREVTVFTGSEQQRQQERSRYVTRIERWRTLVDGGGILAGVLGALVAVQLFSQGGRALTETLVNLRKSEELYRALAHNFPNGSIFLFDHDLRYLVADGDDLAKTGFSCRSPEGQTLRDVLPTEAVARLEPLYRATLNGETLVEEFAMGDQIYLLQFLPLRDEMDSIYAGLLINQNITVRKRAEEALKLARDEAERANQAKSEFLSRMSHELRTPLNAILGFGQVLEISQLPEEDSQCVQFILKGGRYLLALVDEVLDLAKVESGELGLKLSAVSFAALCEECVAFVKKMAEARSITCTMEDSAAFEVPVWADKHRLRQVLLNLLSNAIKYNREGGRVTLSCKQTLEGRVRLEVRATRCGISAEGMARLFVPFDRLEHAYGEIEGTGLGLVVSKQIAEAMNGTLGVESQPDEGTTFWLELPGLKAAVAETVVSPPVSLPMTGSKNMPGATLLYIEDNLPNLQVVEMVIARRRPQWRLLSARDGQDGLRQAREHLPACILLDMQLPSLNGEEILAELRG